MYSYKRNKPHYILWYRLSPYPSPRWGEGRVRGPIVKKLNAFVSVMTLQSCHSGLDPESSLFNRDSRWVYPVLDTGRE